MADQWYYSENGQRKGPVSEVDLKRLAASGALKPTDKVWKKGMASWAAASEIEGLIPEPVQGGPPPLPWDSAAPSADEPPPSEGVDDALSFLESSSRKSASNTLPVGTSAPPPAAHRTHDWVTKTKAAVSAAAQRGKAAAQLVAKQAERTKLVNVTLPAMYLALGRHIHKEGCFRDEFPEVYKKIDGLLAQIAALQPHAANAAKVEGLSAKAKAAAKATSDMAQTQAVKLKLNHALTELGKAVFEKHAEQSAPAEVVGPIVNCRARIKKLDAEIADLSKAQIGQILTPKRIVFAGGVISVLLLLFLGKWMFFGANTPQPSSGAVAMASGGRSGQHSATTAPYAHLKDRVRKIVTEGMLKLDRLPDSDRRDNAQERLFHQVNDLYAAIQPLPCTIDPSCHNVVLDASASSPWLAEIVGDANETQFMVRLECTMKAQPSDERGVVGTLYGKDGAIILESTLTLEGKAGSSDKVAAKFYCGSEDTLASACSFSIARQFTRADIQQSPAPPAPVNEQALHTQQSLPRELVLKKPVVDAEDMVLYGRGLAYRTLDDKLGMEFSGDGRLLAVSDGSKIFVWSLASRRAVAAIRASNSAIRSASTRTVLGWLRLQVSRFRYGHCQMAS